MTLHLLDRGLAIVSWAAAVLVIVLLFAGPSLIGAKASNPTAPYGGSATPSSAPAPGAQAPGAQAPGAQAAGAQVFARAGCSSCHTLKAASATGTTGPNLDQLRPTAAAVSAVVRSGAGVMPSFSGKLSAAQITAVASYVSSVAGR